MARFAGFFMMSAYQRLQKLLVGEAASACVIAPPPADSRMNAAAVKIHVLKLHLPPDRMMKHYAFIIRRRQHRREQRYRTTV